jgi:multicomponent Na+:H+ antiporter subunit D
VLVGSLLALLYVWRLIELAYFSAPNAATQDAREAPLGLLLATWALVIANVYLGIDTELTRGSSEMAAQALIGGLR